MVELDDVVYQLCGYVSVVYTLRAQAGAPVVQFDQVCNQMAMLFHCNKSVCGAPQLYGISIVTAEDNLGQLAISGCIQYAVARQRSVSMHHGLGQRRPLRLVCTNVKNPSIVGNITQGHVTEHHNHPREWKTRDCVRTRGCPTCGVLVMKHNLDGAPHGINPAHNSLASVTCLNTTLHVAYRHKSPTGHDVHTTTPSTPPVQVASVLASHCIADTQRHTTQPDAQAPRNNLPNLAAPPCKYGTLHKLIGLRPGMQ